YVLGFNLIFWSAALHLVSVNSKGFKFKLNAPLIGIMAGMLIAIFDLFDDIPGFVLPILEFSADYTLDMMMVLLGAVLGTIPKEDFKYRPEFGYLMLIRFVFYPLVILALAALLPLDFLSAELQWGIRLALVVQAAVPPATNIMLAAKLYGSEKQVHYIGTGILITYLASLASLPLFLSAATLLFR
ncbi:MAG TPA: hypothetical protein ENN41_03480, partial [Sediminispirochaeta sp.]|nr:hypothetical protein [Sediminispirochaeta sp.]